MDDIEFRTPDPSHRLHLYNAANELLWVGGNGVRTAFAYDAWGRAVSKSWAKDPATTYTAAYTWQMGDKLRQIETDFPGERDVWYNYDGLGKRRNKLYANPDDLHWYRWAGWSVLSEYDTAGASGWEIPAAAARVDVAGLAERGAGAAYAYRLHDHLGSVRGLLGASKAPLARYAYAPYGELNHGAGRPLHRGFTGHHWDAESGMYYAPFRYYMPGAGRWLSRDPLGFVDGFNLYPYPFNPINYLDPLGLKWCPPGWLGPVLVTAGAVAGSLGGVAYTSASGVALGMGPVGWGLLALAMAGSGIVSSLWNLRGQAESVIENTGIGIPVNRRNRGIDDILDDLDDNPGGRKPQRDASPRDPC